MNNLNNRKGSWINGLDSIRFILALIVFLSHLDNPVYEYLVKSSSGALRALGMLTGVLFNGIGSVMAFFIISGFVIHYPNKDSNPETIPFLARRWLRIGLPLLVIAPIASAFHWFSKIPIWSLYCELTYYTLYPLLIRVRLSWTMKFAISFVVALVMIGTMAPNDMQSMIHQKNLQYSGAYWQLGDLLTWIVGLPCWLLGVILAQNIDSYRRAPGRTGIYAWRLFVVAASIVTQIGKFHLFVSYFFTMNFFAILLFFWLKNEILYFMDKKPVRYLESAGKFSYSLYLCHNVFAHFLLLVMPLTPFTYFPIIIFVVLGSYLFFVVVEYPSHQLSKFIGKKVGVGRIATA